ncbi:MAG: hypothetical protein AMXMBFR74_19340 [Parvibaculum sp.]
MPWVALIVWYRGPRADIALKIGEGGWLFEQSLALTTALVAGLAALCASIPGRPVWERVLPLLPLGLWIAIVVGGSVRSVMVGGAWSSLVKVDWVCLPNIASLGVVPAIAMISLIRRGAPVSPYATIGYAALAATALAEFGLRFFHAEDASLMILVWQMGSVALLTAICTVFARHLFPWRIGIRTVTG